MSSTTIYHLTSPCEFIHEHYVAEMWNLDVVLLLLNLHSCQHSWLRKRWHNLIRGVNGTLRPFKVIQNHWNCYQPFKQLLLTLDDTYNVGHISQHIRRMTKKTSFNPLGSDDPWMWTGLWNLVWKAIIPVLSAGETALFYVHWSRHGTGVWRTHGRIDGQGSLRRDALCTIAALLSRVKTLYLIEFIQVFVN